MRLSFRVISSFHEIILSCIVFSLFSIFLSLNIIIFAFGLNIYNKWWKISLNLVFFSSSSTLVNFPPYLKVYYASKANVAITLSSDKVCNVVINTIQLMAESSMLLNNRLLAPDSLKISCKLSIKISWRTMDFFYHFLNVRWCTRNMTPCT